MSPVRPGWIGPMEWGSLSGEEQAEVAGMDPARFAEWSAKGQAAESRPREPVIEAEARGAAKHTMTRTRTLSLLAVGALVLLVLSVAVTDRHSGSLSTGDIVGVLLFVAAALCFLAFIVVALVGRHQR